MFPRLFITKFTACRNNDIKLSLFPLLDFPVPYVCFLGSALRFVSNFML